MITQIHLSILALLAQLYLAGVDISWRTFHSKETRKKVVLPRYPFQRQRYWYAPFYAAETTDINSSIFHQFVVFYYIFFCLNFIFDDGIDLQHLPYLMLRSIHSASNVHIFETKLALDGGI